MDVTPREVPTRRPRRWWAVLLVVLVLGALVLVATRALGEATLFFYNADEAVEKRDELGDDRFQLQGTVVEGSIIESGDVVEFVVTFNDVEVQVVHRGDPPEMFQPGTPVVLQGRWDDSADVFSSDRMLVKHDEEYEAEHPDRAPTSTSPAVTAP
jgi:cytochrome c-type biogenesis protein CcmE